MSRCKPSPTVEHTQEFQKELNRLHRRRLAIINLIRSVEEYLLVAESGDTLSGEVPKKPNLRVVYARAVKEILA